MRSTPCEAGRAAVPGHLRSFKLLGRTTAPDWVQSFGFGGRMSAAADTDRSGFAGTADRSSLKLDVRNTPIGLRLKLPQLRPRSGSFLLARTGAANPDRKFDYPLPMPDRQRFPSFAVGHRTHTVGHDQSVTGDCFRVVRRTQAANAACSRSLSGLSRAGLFRRPCDVVCGGARRSRLVRDA